MPTQEEEEAFAEQMLDEALEEYRRVLPEDELQALRGCLRDELLFHPDGRARLRRAMPDPATDKSGTKAKERPVEAPGAKKRGKAG